MQWCSSPLHADLYLLYEQIRDCFVNTVSLKFQRMKLQNSNILNAKSVRQVHVISLKTP